MRQSAIHRFIRFAGHRSWIPLDTVTRGWLVVTGGSVARLALGFITSIVIARSLGPSAFGIFSVLAATAAIVGAIGDIGLTNAAVRRIAAVWLKDAERTAQIWQVFFWVRSFAVIVVVAMGLLFAGPIARYFLGLPEETQLLRYALLGVAATAISGTTTAVLQATGHFGRLAAVMLANSGLTLVLAVGLAAAQQLTLHTTILVLGVGTSLMSFAVGYRLLPGTWPLSVPGRGTLRSDGSDLVRFGSWLWIGGILSIMATQIDVLLVNLWTVPATVGIYSLAVSLASRVEVVNHSLYTVLLVSASTVETPEDIRHYIRAGLLRSAAVSVLLLPLIPLAGPFINAFYGSAYDPAASFFQALLLVTILNIMIAPLVMLGFTFDRPQLIAATDGARVATLLVTAVLLIPTFGASGAIAAKLCATVAGGSVLAVFLTRRNLTLKDTTVDID